MLNYALKCIAQDSVTFTVHSIALSYLIFHLIAQHIFGAASAGFNAEDLLFYWAGRASGSNV